ncbi:hypothetical protein PIB30_003275 [Stylosanthes scabra]|uniref:Uncharacterized protein n=1 Tax=Stylosanthes scabra TaxID=79078 RepID=A0ABU6S339_9FABA|nr:hypothetical protein [Stylosanthes scabra]
MRNPSRERIQSEEVTSSLFPYQQPSRRRHPPTKKHCSSLEGTVSAFSRLMERREGYGIQRNTERQGQKQMIRRKRSTTRKEKEIAFGFQTRKNENHYAKELCLFV